MVYWREILNGDITMHSKGNLIQLESLWTIYMGIVAFFFRWHTAEYANHFSLKQAWGFHSPH